MQSYADLLINLLDLAAFFLVASGIIGEQRMLTLYTRWFGVMHYIYKVPVWSPGISRFHIALLGVPLFGLIVELASGMKLLSGVSLYYFVGILGVLAGITLLFDWAAHRSGFVRVMAVWGSVFFVLARLISIRKATDFWRWVVASVV